VCVLHKYVSMWWLGSRVVSMLDSSVVGRGFILQPVIEFELPLTFSLLSVNQWL